MSLSEDKTETRRALRAARRATTPEDRARASQDACAHLLKSEAWSRADPVALFAPFGAEADPTSLAEHAPGRVAFPQVVGDRLVFRAAPLSVMRPAPPFGILEPDPRFEALTAFGLVVVPGLGFTRDGDRIGYGGGYYDRALRALRAARPDVLAVGFGFALQVADALPVGPHDERLDAVVTEAGFSWTRARPA